MNTASTKATFSVAGTYSFRVTASDGQLSASDDVIVVVNATATTTSNKAPTVSAGADQTILLPATATLTATASDDGLPNTTLTYQWTLITGTGASINNPTLSSVQVSFTAVGSYTFRVHGQRWAAYCVGRRNDCRGFSNSKFDAYGVEER